MNLYTVSTPIGAIDFAYEVDLVRRIHFNSTGNSKVPVNSFEELIADEIKCYFQGGLKQFTLPYDLGVSGFQKDVLLAILSVPYGCTITYGELAHKCGHPKAYQAVGTACGRNALPLLIPCHRVVGRNRIGGFSGGLEIKRALLQLEGAIIL